MILVTGASGLVGSHLIHELVKKDLPVRAIYRNTIPTHFPESVEWVKADILDISSIENAMQGVEEVYHCAAIVSFHPSSRNLMYRTNVEGTANIVNAAIDHNIRKFLFVSSVAALGRNRNGKSVTEKMNWSEESSNSEYGKSKFLAEMEVWRGIGEGLNAAIINPVIILGAGDWNKGSTEIFKTAYDEFPWYTEGTSGFVDVMDVVKAMMLLMRGSSHAERFIISSETLPFKEVFTEIAHQFHKKPPHRIVTPLLASLVWRYEALKSFFTGHEPLLTKETALTAQTKVHFENNKFLTYAQNFEYTPIKQSIERICQELTVLYRL